MPNTQQLIDVCIKTYNSEKTIEETLESVLNQKTSYSYKLRIFDDCSSDNTLNILKKYKLKYPDKFQIQINEKNLGMVLNSWHAFKSCKSKYVCILDSDDVWTNKSKLELQISFLEENNDYVMTCGKPYTFNDITKEKIERINNNKLEMDLFDLLRNASIWNSSVVYRNLFDKVSKPEWVDVQEINEDFTIHALHAKYGKIKYFDEVLGCYRIHLNNSSFINDVDRDEEVLLNHIYIEKNLKIELESKYHRLLNRKISRHFASLFRFNFKKKGKINIQCFFKMAYFTVISLPSIRDLRDVRYLAFKA